VDPLGSIQPSPKNWGEMTPKHPSSFPLRVFLVSKEFVSIATEKEKWFGTAYKQEYLPEELIKKCETCEIISELHLPTPNEFIPTDFQLFSKEKNSTRPQLPTKIKVKSK